MSKQLLDVTVEKYLNDLMHKEGLVGTSEVGLTGLGFKAGRGIRGRAYGFRV